MRRLPRLDTVKVELARRKLIHFIHHTKQDYIAEPFHVSLCEHLDQVVEGHIKRLMVFAPPQHGKSEIVSRRLPAYAFGRNPKLRIIGASYSSDLAGRNNRDVQRVMDDSQYHQVFDTRIPAANNRTQAFGALRNSEIFEILGTGGSYRPAGRGQGITGMPCDLAIIDDIVKDDEEAFSPTVREATWEWYTGSLYTRMAQNGAIVFTTTRWHRDDLAGRLLKLAKDQGWIVLTFPAIAPELPAPYDHRKPGEPLCPSRFDLTALEDRKRTLGPIKWGAMYEQDPRPEGSTEFPPDWFGPDVWFDDWPGDWICRVIALDPSKGKEAKAGDFGAFVEAVVARDGRMYVDAQIGRWNTDTLAEMAVESCQRFGPDAFGCETLQFQQLLADNIDRLAKARGVFIRTTPLEDVTKKVIRVRRLTPYLAKREIRFKANSAGTKLLVEQLQDFPHGAHDDGPDALEMAVRLAHQVMRGNAELPEEYV